MSSYHYEEVVPAYGRSYKNQAEVKKDWEENKDFRMTTTGGYINKADAEKYGVTNVVLRYGARQEKLATLKK